MARTALKQDAQNRALRTALQGLAIDVGVALVLVLATVFADADDWGDLQWSLLGLTLVKTLLQTIASYVMRRFVNVALPPTPQPAPATTDPAP